MNELGLTTAQEEVFDKRKRKIGVDWTNAVIELADLVERWATVHADELHWEVTKHETTLSEEAVGGSYTVPIIELVSGFEKVVLEPIARGVLGAEGRVDLFAWPTLFRVSLLRQKNGSWIVRTDSGIDWPHPWNEETFIELATSLLHAK